MMKNMFRLLDSFPVSPPPVTRKQVKVNKNRIIKAYQKGSSYTDDKQRITLSTNHNDNLLTHITTLLIDLIRKDLRQVIAINQHTIVRIMNI